MTVEQFKQQFGIEKISVYEIDGHLYPETIPVHVCINKNISLADLKNKVKFEILKHYETYILSKDSTISHLGLPIEGNWTKGYALDLHTTKSTLIGTDDNGKNKFETIRPYIAEELYKLKYWKEEWRVQNIANQASYFLRKHLPSWQISYIIPIPPSDITRPFQPVYKLAEAIGNLCNLQVNYNLLKKAKSTSQLKDIEDPGQRKVILDGAFDTTQNSLTDRNILLFDDLYRSGETLKAAVQILKNKAGVKNVYILTITKTRSKR
jgi:competence protein ComFC